jgi:hypothetical protein
MLPLLADAGDLAQWANRLDAPGYLPKLIRRLILATAGDIRKLEMRSGEGTRYSGYDGYLEVGRGHTFVPTGLSVWEMGVNQEPKGKADDDYNKRSADPLGLDPSQVTFVFVTPRRWASKEDWAGEKRRAGLWRDVWVIDADNFEPWLELSPAVHIWISHIIGKDPGDIQDLETFWENWREATQPPLSAELITSGRDADTVRIMQHLQAQPSTLTVRADSQEEALAFIAAAFDRLPDLERGAIFARTLIVESVHVWRQITFTEQPIILLPTFKPIEVAQATRHGHHVLIPAGRETVESRGMVVLQRSPRQVIAAALQSMGCTQERASSLASVARRSMLSLRRTLSINPEVQQPVWATPEKARAIFPALLAGSWDDAVEGDQRAIAALVGRSYEAIITDLLQYINQSDPPIQQIGTTWSITSKEDAWQLLARYLTRHDLDRFSNTTIDVLGMLDPALELPIDKRWMANALEHSRPHSKLLREGLAHTLALIATRASDTLLGGTATGQNYATFIVRQLLEKANEDQSGQIWVSLSDILPLLAEASPDSFLNAIDNASLGADPVILKLFTDTSGDPFTTSSAHPNLLWALERLAWSPNYLGSAMLCLARLVRLAPGGRLTNRPGHSLRAIFCPWWPQTAASFEERLRILDMLCQQEPEVSWKLILSLLPTPHETADPTDSPQWRDWKPEEQKDSFSLVEWWDATEKFVERLVADVATSANRICDLVKRINNLPPPSRVLVFNYLEALDPSAFDTNDRKTIQAELREQVSSHRRFAQASWAMPVEDVERLALIYEHFNSENLIEQVSWLFTAWPQLPDVTDNDDFKKRESAVYQARVSAAQQVYQTEDLHGIFALIEVAEQPAVLGWILGKSGLIEKDEDRLLDELGSSDVKRRQAATAYVEGGFLERGWEWADKKLDANSLLLTPNQQADFFLHLPTGSETWKRLERYGSDTVDLYWTQFLPRVEDSADCPRAVGQLLARGRAWEALVLIEPYLENVAPPVGLVMDILELAIRTPLKGTMLQSLLYDLSQLFNYLERTEGVDEERLARIEWAFLPLFRYEKRSFKVLHSQLAADPAFFVELISAAYRATGEEPGELDEKKQFLAKAAYYLLQSANVVPGTQSDGTIDAEKLYIWVNETRRLLADCKRLRIGDQRIGHILRSAKLDGDELWPAKVIRDLLEALRSDDIELGMEIGIRNDRGITWRNPTDGGQQERQIAEHYRALAQLVQDQWPRTARMLRRIAHAYEEDAQRNDRDAELRQERW